jgi:PAS domain S-box-containing protein
LPIASAYSTLRRTRCAEGDLERHALTGGAVRGDWSAFVDVLDVLAEAVTIRDRDGTIAYANQAALASMGFPSVEAMRSRSSTSIMDDYLVEDEHGNPLTIDDVPSMRMMHGESAEPLVMRTTHRETGATRWHQLKTTPLVDQNGELMAAVTVIEDVTAVKTAEVRMRMLAESGRILASSLDYQQTLRNVANLAVPRLADWCAVDLVSPELRREYVVVAHQDPAKIELAARVREFEPDRIDPENATARVLRTNTSELYTDVTDEQIAQGARSEEHLRLLRQLKIRSVLVVPMRVPRKTIGVMTLVSAESRRRLTEEDVELAEQLARRAAVAVENARLHTMLSDVAETLQHSLLPDPLPEIPGWEIASLYRPAGGEQRIDVGGDFYDVFPVDDAWFVIIGDVTGKGVSAAALTALLRHGARFATRHDPRPGAVLSQLDEALRGRSGESLCTALCVRIESDRFVISSGGHPPALILGGDGRVREAPQSGPLLGAFPDGEWPEESFGISAQDMLLVYTDGVTETEGTGERFGALRLRGLLAENAGLAPAELLARLDRALDEFRAGARDDDIAALALRPRR